MTSPTPPAPSTPPTPLLVYRADTPCGQSRFEIIGDQLVWSGTSPFRGTARMYYDLKSLDPKPNEFTMKHRGARWIMVFALFVLSVLTVSFLGLALTQTPQSARLGPPYLQMFWACAAATAVLVVLLAINPWRTHMRSFYYRSPHQHAFSIAKIGPDAERFEEFVNSLSGKIRALTPTYKTVWKSASDASTRTSG